MTNVFIYVFIFPVSYITGIKNCPGIFPQSVKHEQHQTDFVGERKNPLEFILFFSMEKQIWEKNPSWKYFFFIRFQHEKINSSGIFEK